MTLFNIAYILKYKFKLISFDQVHKSDIIRYNHFNSIILSNKEIH